MRSMMLSRLRRGTTLLEMMVYCAVFSMVGVGMAGTFTIGNRWYMQNRAIISAEESADVAARRLAREIIESHLTGISYFPNSVQQNSLPGVIFISPHNPAADDRFGFNPSTGAARWYKYVCYYVDVDPASDPGASSQSYAVFRCEYAFWDASSSQCDILPSKCARDTNWFRDNATRKLVIAHNIASPQLVAPYGGWHVFSSTGGVSTQDVASNPITIDVTTNVYFHSSTKNTINCQISVAVRN